MKIVYYTVYNKETDEIVASGNASECAKAMGKSLNGFHSMVSKNLKGKHNKYEICKEILNKDE